MRLAALVSIVFLILTFSLLAQESLPPGRYLPDGTFQPRNLHATEEAPSPGMPAREPLPDFREEITSIDWGPDVWLDNPPIRPFFSTIAAGENGYVHIVADSFPTFEPYYFRSTDLGYSWERGVPIAESTGVDVVYPRLFAESTLVTYIGPNVRSIYSRDDGSNWNIRWIGQGRGPDATLLGDSMFAAYFTDDQQTIIFLSTDFGATWRNHSWATWRYGQLCLGATGLGLHLLNESGDQEIYYSCHLFSEGAWSAPMRLSDTLDSNSFDSRLAAWGDSNVAAVWVDYKYSPYPWTGDLIMKRSTDNGATWMPEQQLTFDHLAFDKFLAERGDSLFLVYTSVVLDGRTNTEEIFFNFSSDGGESWGEPSRLTYADHRSINPQLCLQGDFVHVCFADSRNDTLWGNHTSLYYKRGRISQTGIFDEGESPRPEEIGLFAYPNPFNGPVAITLDGLKGGDNRLAIYDLQGRQVREYRIKGSERKKIVWDAKDAAGKQVCSGLYFARASTPQTEKTIKLLLLR